MTKGGPPRAVHARAPGKINIFLKVGSLSGTGDPEVAAVYQAVSLCDDVHASLAADFSVGFSGTVDTATLSRDGTNLAIRAATLLARKTGYRGGVRLQIDKNVPVAGGMGGGSADAAATLVACDALWDTNLPREELLALAVQLGADVPFAFTGGTAIGTGRGDEISPALAWGHFQWVLVFPDLAMSTPRVYQELDRHRHRHSRDIFPAEVQPHLDRNVLKAVRAGDPLMLAEALHNDLQAPALHLRPELAAIIELGEENGALAGIVSGAGPTVAFLAADVDHALELQIALSAAGHTVVRATGPVRGARLIGD